MQATIPSGSNPTASESPSQGHVLTDRMPGCDSAVAIHLVLARDELYVPIAIGKPAGDGPFPAITMGRGNGRGGVPHVVQQVQRLAAMQERMIERGYAVAYVNYRNEIPHLITSGAFSSSPTSGCVKRARIPPGRALITPITAIRSSIDLPMARIARIPCNCRRSSCSCDFSTST